jgi:hypothetical protein
MILLSDFPSGYAVEVEGSKGWVELTVTLFETKEAAEQHIATVCKPEIPDGSVRFRVAERRPRMCILRDLDGHIRGAVVLYDDEHLRDFSDLTRIDSVKGFQLLEQEVTNATTSTECG